MEIELILAIDVGGTHISAALINKNTMRLHQQAYVCGEVDSNASRESILNDWDKVLTKVLNLAKSTVHACVISIPGPFDYVNGISEMDGMHKYQAILGMDVKQYFHDKYLIPREHIVFFNDAHAFLLGEIYHHQLADATVVGLTLGTGLGSALYDGGHAKDLNFGSAAFRDGIAEDYISTRGLLDHLKMQGIDQYNNVKEVMCDPNSDTHRDITVDFLSHSLIDFHQQYIHAIAPDYVIIGGSIAKSHHLFLEKVRDRIEIPIRVASFDEINLFYGMISNINL